MSFDCTSCGCSNAFVTQKLAAAWLAMRLDMLGLAVLTACGVLVIAVDVEPGGWLLAHTHPHLFSFVVYVFVCCWFG